MGIGSIMQAKRILIIAIGENKAKAIKQLIDGNVTPKCPASVLQFHTDVTLMLDKVPHHFFNINFKEKSKWLKKKNFI